MIVTSDLTRRPWRIRASRSASTRRRAHPRSCRRQAVIATTGASATVWLSGRAFCSIDKADSPSGCDLVLENLALRQQLTMLTRRRRRVRVEPMDRMFWLALRAPGSSGPMRSRSSSWKPWWSGIGARSAPLAAGGPPGRPAERHPLHARQPVRRASGNQALLPTLGMRSSRVLQLGWS